MSSLYNELLANLGKEASSDENVKKGMEGLDTEELIVLAEELSALTGDSELADMAKVLPVYQSGGKVDKEIATEQTIQNVKPGDTDVVNPESEPLVTGPGAEGEATDVVASEEEEGTDKEAEGTTNEGTEKEAKEDEKEEKEKKDKDEKDEKEEKEKKDKDEKDEKEDKEASEENEGQEVTATEVLYSILKEGAALEDMIETRASEMVDQMIKEAEDYEVARNIVDAASTQLANGNAVKAHDYSEQMMDKVKTVAAAKDVPMSEAAQAVAGEVLNLAGKTANFNVVESEEKVAENNEGVDPTTALDKLAEYSLALEQEYEKVAEQIGETAEALIRDMGVKQGLRDPQLFEFVSKSMEEVKTHAAKHNMNLAQAAQAFVAGQTGSGVGYVEPTVPSPSQVPSPVKQPINSNQTQDPDKYLPQMAATADPQAMTAAADKEAAVKEHIKSLLKEAMLKGLQQK